eukprot:UN26905
MIISLLEKKGCLSFSTTPPDERTEVQCHSLGRVVMLLFISILNISFDDSQINKKDETRHAKKKKMTTFALLLIITRIF